MFFNFWSSKPLDPDWIRIRIGIQPKMLDPDPYLSNENGSATLIFSLFWQVPLGLGTWGVPLGLQVVGGLNADRNTLAVAREAQRIFGGWVPPSPLE
jgi:hypothetical protein